jgi:hypothetical protein
VTQEKLHRHFRALVDQSPSQGWFANQHGLQKQQVSGMYTGNLPVTGKILAQLGFKRIVVETFIPLDAEVVIPEGFSEVQVNDTGRIVNRYKTVQRRRARQAQES